MRDLHETFLQGKTHEKSNSNNVGEAILIR